MKVAVVCANGRVGRLVVKEAIDRGLDITAIAKAQGKALEELRKRNDVRWTVISPAGDFQADGERTGEYILAGEELALNSRGESIISYMDYAIAMVDEITKYPPPRECGMTGNGLKNIFQTFIRNMESGTFIPAERKRNTG